MDSINDSLSPLHQLILSYARPSDRLRYKFLFAFDMRLAEIIRNTTEPLIGQMRLTWWRDILDKPKSDRPENEPLIALLNQVQEGESSSSNLQELIDGWEVMLDDFPWDERQLDVYAHRGSAFFAFALDRLDLPIEITNASKLWAYWDFAMHCSDPLMRTEAFQRCQNLHGESEAPVFDRNGRILSILWKLAMRDVKSGRLSETLYRPSTAAHIIWHGFTGR